MDRQMSYQEKTVDNKWIKENVGYLLDIWRKIEKNKAIFFIGSGFSRVFGITNWEGFIKSLLNNLIIRAEKIKSNQFIIPEQFMKYDEQTIGKIVDNLKNFQNRLEHSEKLNLDILLEKIFYVINLKRENYKEITFYEVVKATYLEHFVVNEKKIFDKKILLDSMKIVGKKIITTNYDNLFQYDEEQWDESSKALLSIDINEELPAKLLKQDLNFFLPIHGHVFNHYFLERIHSIWERCEFLTPKQNCTNENDFIQNHFPIIDSFSQFKLNYYDNPNRDKYNLKDILSKLLLGCIDQEASLIFIGYSFDDSFVTDTLLETLNKIKSEEDIGINYFSPAIYILNYDLEDPFGERTYSIPNDYFIRNISIGDIVALKNLDLMVSKIQKIDRNTKPTEKGWLEILYRLHSLNKDWYNSIKEEVEYVTKPFRCEASSSIVDALENFLFYLKIEINLLNKLENKQKINDDYVQEKIKSINFNRNKNYLFIVAILWEINGLRPGEKSEFKNSIKKLLEIFFNKEKIEQKWINDLIFFARQKEVGIDKLQYWLMLIEEVYYKNREYVDPEKRKIYEGKIKQLNEKINLGGTK